ncbi:MAG: F0F1 ATP synthase subunit epsilon [Planctomycetota bacterium]|nr:MAG: F0F1 ATP synthase subunit epsilon [Planctomycetota bacterium]REJ96804.1 MAG: F0F1 ATP synthase subunit epsilon [Planctomycetota bacterium]REK23995.1 MAG: F0F1 ATP synthase subunit epsilon [Planctomycetota bacterium]REK39326.1 MAG: F0F1 ATP synthase subunit epsilon [Planctomycetota bacterium]
MNLKVLLPNEVFMDREVTKVTAEAQNGYFCLLPRHVDFVAALVPGLLSFEDEDGREHFLAIDEGALVKCGPEVLVSTRSAAADGDLGQLRHVVEEQFEVLDERERLARSATARLEAGLVRRFMEFDKPR